MMKNCVLLVVTFAMLAFCRLGSCSRSGAQYRLGNRSSQGQMQADKASILTATMNFNDKDGAAFWPIYRQYEHERSSAG